MGAFSRLTGCRIADGYSLNGLPLMVLENERLRVSVLLGRGADVHELLYKPKDLSVLAYDPVGAESPLRRLASVPGDHGPFLDLYGGGWQEVLPAGGAPSRHQGAVHGQHGEASLLPWEGRIVEDTEDRVAAEVWVRPPRTPLLLRKTLALNRGDSCVYVQEALVNESPAAVDVLWGHHIAFGPPLVGEGCRIEIGPYSAWTEEPIPGLGPRLVGPDRHGVWPLPLASGGDLSTVTSAWFGKAEMAYLGPGIGSYDLVSPRWQVRVRVSWSAGVFPYLWVWWEWQAQREFPWWGRGRYLGLEPWTGYPTTGLDRAARQGRVRTMKGGETLHARLALRVMDALPSTA